MISLPNPFQLIEQTRIAAWVREDDFAFPVLDAVHVCAIMLVLGSIVMMDLRLVGVTSRFQRVTQSSREVLPWTWSAFALAVISGLLLMSGQAGAYAANVQFRLKMALLLGAGINMLLFQCFAWRRVGDWDQTWPPPLPVRLAGGLSIALWIGVAIAGRWVGWTVSAAPY
jgi:hypothetical protein